jgi:hypothetical protein
MEKKKKSEVKLSLRERALISERSKNFDPNATAEDCIDDIRILQKEHEDGHITRNFYRAHGKYSDSTWNQYFGTFLEFRRQAKLELSRAQHVIERQIAKQASLDVYRQFYNQEVLPWHDKFSWADKTNKRFKTIATASDLHDKDLDSFVFGVFVDMCKRRQPDIICLNGDIFDCPEFSKYNVDIRSFDIKGRFEFVHEKILKPLREACPNSQIDFIIGNHEFRIIKLLAEKSPNIRVLLSDVMGLTLSDVFGLKKFKVNLISKIDLAAFDNSGIEEEITQNYKIYFNTWVACHFKDLTMGLSGTNGHTHRPDQITFTSLPMGKMTWTNTGCMCHTEAEYVEGRDKWTKSFLWTTIDTLEKTAIPEHYIFTGNFMVMDGLLYKRSDYEETA